ncbi:DUF7940 domain-containing protein [Bosea sp. NPDC055332]
MKLASNWRAVIRHAWSLRLALLSAVLGAAEVAVEVFISDPPISRGVFAALAAAVSLAAAVARVVAQTPISGE